MAKSKAKSTRGRKPRAGQAGKGVTVRLTDAERAAFTDAAGDQALADWMRAACKAALPATVRAKLG